MSGAVDERPAERHRQVCGVFTDLVVGTRRWDAPTPVAGWLARDVVRHLTQWLPGFLAAGAGLRLPPGPSVDDDPVGAWRAQRDAAQALLDDPADAARPLTAPHGGQIRLDEAIARFYTPDVFMHSWDLARSTGQHVRLDPDMCAELLAGMTPMEAAMRSSGHYGPRVPVPEGADPQTQLLGFIGRDPDWAPPGEAAS